MEIITGYTGKPHITAEQARDLNQGIVGTSSYVMNVGQKLRLEVKSNNELAMYDGILVHQGCAASIKKNTYDTLTIENGTQGMKRIDLIVARYSRSAGSGAESVEVIVIKGTPVASNPEIPAYRTGTVQLGDTVDMPLYKVRIEELSIKSVDKLFEEVDNLGKLSGKCAYAWNYYTAPEIVVQAGTRYTLRKDTIKTAGGSCVVNVYGAIKTSESAAAAVLEVTIDGEYSDAEYVRARTISTNDIEVNATEIFKNLGAGTHEIEMKLYVDASQNASATLCKDHTYGMSCIEV